MLISFFFFKWLFKPTCIRDQIKKFTNHLWNTLILSYNKLTTQYEQFHSIDLKNKNKTTNVKIEHLQTTSLSFI